MPNTLAPEKALSILLPACVLLAAGCHSIGPSTISRDRFDYSSDLAQSWKNQMLLNLVKTRYLDMPIFLDVGQIVSGYTLETVASLGVSVAETNAFGGNTGSLGGATRYTDRPTITYMPLTGDRFLQGLLTPIDPTKIFALVQAGFPADFVLELGVDTLNGLRNRATGFGARRQSDPEFFRAIAALREIQDAGAIGLRTGDGPIASLFFRTDLVDENVQARLEELRELLGLSPGRSEYGLMVSPLRGGDDELAINTRSLSQVLSALSLGVEVPPDHQERRLTPPILPDAAAEEQPLLRIRGGPSHPPDAFVAVPYEGQWFWIENDDWRSKRTFSSILFLFTLTNTDSKDRAPLLTIPAQ